MNLNIKLILIVAISATLFILTLVNISKQKEATPPPRVITLSNTDTIYQKIEILKLKSDTIKIKYETKINNYRHSSTTNKISLFSDRINR
jgi:hypothetical protein